METIPKFSAYSWRANCLLNKIENLEQIKQDEIDFAENINNTSPYNSDLIKPPIDSGDIYISRNRCILLGQSKIEAFENYFQIKEIKVSWNLNGTWTGVERDDVNGWNGGHSYSSNDSISYIIGIRNSDSSIKYHLPPERCCDGLNNQIIREPEYNNDWRTTLGWNALGTLNYNYSVSDYGIRGFGNNLYFHGIIFVGNYPEYNQIVTFGNAGFGSSNEESYLIQIPLKIFDRGNVYETKTFVRFSKRWTSNFSANGSMQFEIIRYQFEN